MVYVPVRAIIHSLKSVDYLPVQTHTPYNNLHLSNTVTTQQADSAPPPPRLNVGREGTTKLRGPFLAKASLLAAAYILSRR